VASQPAARNEAANAAARALRSFEELIALAGEKRDLGMKSALERDVRLVRFEDGRIEIGLEPSAAKTLTGDLSKKLGDWTGRRWMVIVSAEPGAPTLRAQAQSRKAELKDGVRGDPLVQAVLARFPGAEIVDVRPPAGEPATLDEMPFDAPGEPGRTDDEL
jgi:DNA polymerase-3 subunit gamma/tau